MKINLEINPKDLNNNELAEYLIQLEQEINNTEKSPFSDTSFGQWYSDIKKKYEA